MTTTTLIDRTNLTARFTAAGLRFTVDAVVDGVGAARLEVVPARQGTASLDPVGLAVRVEPGASARLRELIVTVSIPTVDVSGLYLCGDPGFELGYLPHERIRRTTAAHRGVPLLGFLRRGGGLTHAVGFSGQALETEWTAQLSELDCEYHLEIRRPFSVSDDDPGIPFTGVWQDELLVGGGLGELREVLAEYGAIVRERSGQTPLVTPDHAYEPVFCTWTARHHDISEEWSAAAAPVVADLGFRTWITDDGWQVDGGEFGRYDEIGDWRPSAQKFPDFARHVRTVQTAGLRYLLWVAPFMVGSENRLDRQLGIERVPGDAAARFDSLDPASPATAAHVRALLTGLADEFDLDGFKIDFIDALPSRSAAECSTGTAVLEALDRSVGEIARARPGFLVEYRNTYANLANRRTANMFRSSDLPVNYMRNRWQATLLRLLTPDAAVVTDPMLWHPDESDESVAVHLINGIAAVPMVSIDVLRYPESHLAVIRHWMNFYREHRETIFGDFRPDLRGTSIPQTTFTGVEEIIHGLYDDVPVRVDADPRRRWVLNASPRPFVMLEGSMLEGEGSFSRRGIVRDRVGTVLVEVEVRGNERIPVPVGGLLEVVAAANCVPASVRC